MSSEASAPPSRNGLRARRIGAGFAIAAWTATAPAGTASKDLSVTATVVNSCAIKSLPALPLGTYDLDSGTSLATRNAIVSIACTQHTSPTVTVDRGPPNGFTALSPTTQSMPDDLDPDLMVVTVTF